MYRQQILAVCAETIWKDSLFIMWTNELRKCAQMLLLQSAQWAITWENTLE